LITLLNTAGGAVNQPEKNSWSTFGAEIRRGFRAGFWNGPGGLRIAAERNA
jgi:hypothetical protein